MTVLSGLTARGWAAQKDAAEVHSEVEIMQALLLEVRELRQSVQHLAVINARMQITIQELQLQAERVSRASAKLDDIRKQIASVSFQESDVTNHVRSLEKETSEQHDEAHRIELEKRLSGLRALLEQFQTKEAALRAQEADAATVAQNEQDKWQDLSEQLSALSQSLGSYSIPQRSTNQKVR